jgi:hypothetical protein
MAKIPDKIRQFAGGKTAWVATASKSGVPNVTPKGTVKIIDDEHVVFADLFSKKTRTNLQENPYAAVTIIDEQSAAGYQLKGKAEMFDSGELFETAKTEAANAPIDLPEPKYAVLISVESVFDQSAGPEAGKEI